VTCPQEIDVGAYVLDALEPDEMLRMGEHLDRCPICQASVRELDGLPRLLAQVPAPAAPWVFTETPSELAFRRLQSRAAATAAAEDAARRGGTRRWVLVAAAAAAIGLAGGAGGIVAATGPAAPSAVSATEGSVHGSAQLMPFPGGTTISLALDGIPSEQRCELVAVSRDGRWETASDWTASYAGTAHVVGSVRIQPQDIAKLVIRTPDGRTLLSMPS
jgi:hypothetical protein